MATPAQSQLYRPILEIALEAIGNSALSHRNFSEALIVSLSLTERDLEPRLRSGSTRFDKNMRWAVYNLKVAGLMETEKRGVYKITEAGRKFLIDHAGGITQNTLSELQAKLILANDEDATSQAPLSDDSKNTLSDDDATPDEMIEKSHRQLQRQLTDEMLDTLKGLSKSPDQFEQVVVDLLSRMGYGEGRRIGQSGDGGVDGVIYQDPLELDVEKQIYVQAKCWNDAPVRVEDIRGFSGSLGSKQASKGVFITTSRFTADARQAATDALRDSKKIVLIEGTNLAKLMIRYNVGVVPETTYVIKKLDENYFAEDI